MNIEELTKLGGVIPAAPIKTEIKWVRDGEDGTPETLTFDIYVRKLAYIDQERMYRNIGMMDLASDDSDDDDEIAAKRKQIESKSWNAALIATAVRMGDSAQEELTYEQAAHLDPKLAAAMLKAIYLINPIAVKKKAQRPRSNLARTGTARSGRPNNRGSKATSIAG